MRIVITTAIVSLGLLNPCVATAQVSSTPSGSVLDTGIPPNAIDRATAVTDQRRSDLAQSSAVDRLEAERNARAASSRRGPVSGSTLSDGVAGLGTRPDLSPPAGAAPPR